MQRDIDQLTELEVYILIAGYVDAIDALQTRVAQLRARLNGPETRRIDILYGSAKGWDAPAPPPLPEGWDALRGEVTPPEEKLVDAWPRPKKQRAQPEPPEEKFSAPPAKAKRRYSNYWANLSAEERSAEIKRRQGLAKARKKTKARRAAK